MCADDFGHGSCHLVPRSPTDSKISVTIDTPTHLFRRSDSCIDGCGMWTEGFGSRRSRADPPIHGDWKGYERRRRDSSRIWVSSTDTRIMAAEGASVMATDWALRGREEISRDERWD